MLILRGTEANFSEKIATGNFARVRCVAADTDARIRYKLFRRVRRHMDMAGSLVRVTESDRKKFAEAVTVSRRLLIVCAGFEPLVQKWFR